MKWMLAATLMLSACATDADQTLGIANPRAGFHVETLPAGATATVAYGEGAAARVVSCLTPCDLSVPNTLAFRMTISRTGYRTLPFTPPHWRADVLRGWTLEPGVVSVRLQETR